MVTSDVLKPRPAAQSPCVPPTCGCPLLRGHLRGPRCLCDRLLRGDEFTAAYVAEGSAATVRTFEQQSFGRHPRPSGGNARRTAAVEISSTRLDVGRCQFSRYSGRRRENRSGQKWVESGQPVPIAEWRVSATLGDAWRANLELSFMAGRRKAVDWTALPITYRLSSGISTPIASPTPMKPPRSNLDREKSVIAAQRRL